LTRAPASITDKSRQQAQLLKIIKTGITGVGTRGAGTSEFRIIEIGITGVQTRDAGTSEFRDN
jgi:hypothetical protein